MTPRISNDDTWNANAVSEAKSHEPICKTMFVKELTYFNVPAHIILF